MANTVSPSRKQIRPLLQRSSKTTQQPHRGTRTLLLISLGMLAFASLLSLTSNLTLVQEFFIRIIMGLGAAGIAVLIPGFFQIELTWLRNSIRAGGALAVFVLIYLINPPAIERARGLEELAGRYTYECTKDHGTFPHGGYQHGGEATFEVVTTMFGKACSISGQREWTRKDKTAEKVSVDTPSIWRSQGCNFTADDKLIYHYTTTENGANYLGTSTLNIVRDNAGRIMLVGSFQREAPSQETHGTVILKKLAGG